MTMPSSVRPERSLLAPREARGYPKSGEGIHGCSRPSAARSSVTRPSRMAMTRRVAAAMSGSGNDYHGEAVLSVQGLENGHHSSLDWRVQVAGRLVGQQDAGILDQGAGNAHPLLLTAGKLGGPVADAVGEAHPVQGFHGPGGGGHGRCRRAGAAPRWPGQSAGAAGCRSGRRSLSCGCGFRPTGHPPAGPRFRFPGSTLRRWARPGSPECSSWWTCPNPMRPLSPPFRRPGWTRRRRAGRRLRCRPPGRFW